MKYLEIYIIYSIFSSLYLIWIVIQSKRRIFTGLIAFWILSFPILNLDEFVIHTPWNFDLYPTRVFLLVGTLSLVIIGSLRFIKPRRSVSWRKLAIYEIFLIGYILISSMVIILKAPGFREIMPLVSNQIVFGVMYFITRNHLDWEDITRLKQLIIVFGILSVFTSIYQFYFDPEFFRISSERIAFGTYTRANGFMFDEFDNGLLLTCLTGLILTQNRSFISKFILTFSFGLGVLLTMHRGSWLIFCFSIGIFLLFKTRNIGKQGLNKIFILFIPAVVCSLLFLLIYTNINTQPVFDEVFINDQILRDTLEIRIDLARLGLSIINKYPEGIGDFSFNTYGQIYYENGFRFNYGGRPLIVHNGFIAAAVKYGVLGGVCFALFLIFALVYIFRQKRITQSNKIMMLILCLSFIAINMTQELSSFGAFSTILLAFLLSATRIYKVHHEDI